MNLPQLYPEPPHLIVAIFSAAPEVDTFACMCELIVSLDCVPLFLIDVAPRQQDFELLSDLAGEKEVQAVSPARYEQLVRAEDPEQRALRAGYRHSRFGLVVVEYFLRRGTGPHPIGISLSAGALGFPEWLWSEHQRRSAYDLADWSRAVLEKASSECDPLYGAVGTEFSLPTAQRLTSGEGEAGIPTELFVSRQLLLLDRSLYEKLRQAYAGGDLLTWDSGLFCAGWAPFTSQRTSIGNPESTVRASARALGSALLIRG